MNRNSACGVFCGAVLLAVMLSGAARAKEAKPWQLEGALGYGHDSNINRESVLVDSGGYVPFEFLARYDKRFSPVDRLRPTARGTGRLYASPNQDSNETKFGLDLQYDRRLVGSRLGRVQVPSLDFFAKGTAEVRHTTYYSRTSGQEIVVIGPNGPVLLGDRYDSRRYYFRGGLVWRQSRGTRWSTTLTLHRRDYINDYADLPTVDALDYDNWSILFKVRQKLTGQLRAELKYKHTGTVYDAWRVRDFDGNKVPDVFQEFTYNLLSGRVTAKVPGFGSGSLELYSQTRDDPFQGYYNYTEWGIRPRLKYAPGGPLAVSLKYEYSHRDYEKARVRFNPLRPLRNDFENHFEAGLEYATGESSHVFVNFISADVREEDKFYTYTRARTEAGFAISY